MSIRSPQLLVLALLPAALIAGCTKAPAPSSRGTSTVPSTSETSTSSESSTPVSNASAPASSSSASSTPATTASSASPRPSASGEGPAGCATSALKIAVLRGSGAAGHQFAYLQFTNFTSAPCSLVGYPGALLIKAGAPLGQPANRSGAPVEKVILRSGASASARLENNSTCNADSSDSVQVIVPNRTEKVVLPLQMRGCTMMIDPVAAT